MANNIDSLGVLIGQAMSLAMVTVVGQCIGAGDTDQAVKYIKKLMIWCCIAQGASNVLILVFLPQLVGLYGTLSVEARELAMLLIRIHMGCAILLWPASFVLPNALRSANDVRFTMLVSIGSMAFFRVFTSWILCVQLGMGAVGVWIAVVADWICRVGFFVGRMRSGKWKTKYTPV